MVWKARFLFGSLFFMDYCHVIVNSHIEHEHDHRILKQTLATFGKHGARPTNLKLVREVNSVVKLSKDRNMTISKTKTKGILLNPLRKYFFEPQLSIEQGCYVEIVEEQKILGHIIRSDMKNIYYREYMQEGIQEDVDIEKTKVCWLS